MVGEEVKEEHCIRRKKNKDARTEWLRFAEFSGVLDFLICNPVTKNITCVYLCNKVLLGIKAHQKSHNH